MGLVSDKISETNSRISRSSAFVKEKSKPFFQPKKILGKADDVYERQADAVADKVVRQKSEDKIQTKISSLNIQRKCAACEEEEHVQRKEASDLVGGNNAPDIVSDALNGGGNPMDNSTRSFMESRFGYDFGNVKIHTDTVAAKSADSINALAYTSGNDIVFNQGQYTPESDNGKHLLAHELTHVVQQSGDQDLQTKIQRQHRRRTPSVPVVTPRETFGHWNSRPDVEPQRGAHDNKRVSGFTGDATGTYIRSIQVDAHLNNRSTATLTWANRERSRHFRAPPTLDVSVGAGNCSSDCRDNRQSRVDGSHCTPLSPPDRIVEGFADHLSDDVNAKYVTWIDHARHVAFHYYYSPPFAASHGCVRVAEDEKRGAEWIYDNSIAGVTRIRITADPTQHEGRRCWENDERVRRDDPARQEHETPHPRAHPPAHPHTDRHSSRHDVT